MEFLIGSFKAAIINCTYLLFHHPRNNTDKTHSVPLAQLKDYLTVCSLPQPISCTP